MRSPLKLFVASVICVLALLPLTSAICLANCEQAEAMADMAHSTTAVSGCHGAAANTANLAASAHFSHAPATCGQDHLSWPAIVSGSAPAVAQTSIVSLCGPAILSAQSAPSGALGAAVALNRSAPPVSSLAARPVPLRI